MQGYVTRSVFHVTGVFFPCFSACYGRFYRHLIF